LTLRAKLLADLVKCGDIIGVPAEDVTVNARPKLIDRERHVG